MALELPDIWTLSGLVLALLALVTGVISVPSASRIEFLVSRICAVAAAILFFIKISLWGAEDLTTTRTLLVAFFGAVVAISLAFALQWIKKKEDHISKAGVESRFDGTIKLDCSTDAFEFPSDGRLFELITSEDEARTISFQSAWMTKENWLAHPDSIPTFYG